MKNFLIFALVLFVAFESQASGSAAPKSVSIEDFSGAFNLSAGDVKSCAPYVSVINRPNAQDLKILSRDNNVLATFLAIDTEGYYTEPNVDGGSSWISNQLDQGVISEDRADSPFFKPMAIFAKEVASLALSSDAKSLVWKFETANSEAFISCAYSRQ